MATNEQGIVPVRVLTEPIPQDLVRPTRRSARFREAGGPLTIFAAAGVELCPPDYDETGDWVVPNATYIFSNGMPDYAKVWRRAGRKLDRSPNTGAAHQDILRTVLGNGELHLVHLLAGLDPYDCRVYYVYGYMIGELALLGDTPPAGSEI